MWWNIGPLWVHVHVIHVLHVIATLNSPIVSSCFFVLAFATTHPPHPMPLPPTPYKHCPNTNEFHEKIKTVENQSLSIATCQVSCAKANRQLSIIMLSEPEQGWFLIEFSK